MVGPYRPPCETPQALDAEAAAPAAASPWVLPATILGSSLGFIDSSVVNVALPAMQGSLDASLATMQWVVNGYMLMLASLILLGGAAGDRFGERRIFSAGVAGFAAASLVCALAPTVGWLIAARVLQGAAAALLVPSSLAIIGSAYTGEARGRAIGVWAGAGALAMALGPPLGGWLVDTVGWRAIFLINLPLAALTLALARRLPADRVTPSAAPLDAAGALLAVLGLGLLSYGLVALGEGRALLGLVAVAAAAPAVWLFLRVERRARDPMLPLALFRNRDFAGANGLTIVLYAALGASLFLLPFLLIQRHGYSVTAAGAAFLPFSLIMGMGARATGGLVERYGARALLVVGCLIAALGYALLALRADVADFWTGALPGLAALAVGMTVCVPPLTTTVFASAPADRGGAASGVNNAAARSGGLLAVAALGLAFGDAGARAPPPLLAAYRIVMFAAAAAAIAGAALAALTISPRPPAR